jgi:hypothetical protein
LKALIERVGIDRCGLFTATFPDNCSIRAESERRFNSFATHFLREVFSEHIVVPERQDRGAFHHHLAVACHVDIRTGFDFEGCSASNDFKKEHIQKISGRWRWDTEANEERFVAMSRTWYRSANPELKKLWRQIREAAPRYSFGRCELLPILSNEEACARYLGAYVSIQHNRREDEDKGMRTVRYALLERPWTAQWAFVNGGAKSWREGCKVLGALLGGIQERDFLVTFGKHWAFHLAPFVFIASNHAEESLIDAEAMPFGMKWTSRVILVRQLLGRYEDELEGKFDLQQCEDHFISSKPHHLPDSL